MPTPAHPACGPCGPNCNTCALAARYHLSMSDLAILVLIANSFTNEEISRRVGLTPRVLRNRIADLKQKLGTSTRLALAMWAVRHNLITEKEETHERRAGTTYTTVN